MDLRAVISDSCFSCVVGSMVLSVKAGTDGGTGRESVAREGRAQGTSAAQAIMTLCSGTSNVVVNVVVNKNKRGHQCTRVNTT